MRWLRRSWKPLEERRKQQLILGGLAFIAVLVLSPLIPAIIDTVEVHKNPTERNKREFDVSLELAKAITGGVGTIATIAGGIVLYLNFTVANKNAEIANKNAEIAEDKQVAERFSKAIEQLGNKEQMSVRLGGIYSLERIAKDSPEDLWTIVEVLSAFIREYAANRTKGKTHPSFIEAVLQAPEPKEEAKIKLPIDIQSTFTVIDRIYKERTPNQRIELRGIDLNNTFLAEVNLSFADLGRANLSSAYLSSANLSNANLFHANLSNANLRFAKLFYADLRYGNLSNTDLSYGKLSNANLFHTNLSSTDLSFADLSNTNLNSADLSKANFRHTNLSEARLRFADLSFADLRNTDLRNADLAGSDLNNSTLMAADLRNAQNLQISQLIGENRPLLCNVALPDTLAGDHPELAFRDCDQIPQVLEERFGFSPEVAAEIVDSAKQKQWD